MLLRSLLPVSSRCADTAGAGAGTGTAGLVADAPRLLRPFIPCVLFPDAIEDDDDVGNTATCAAVDGTERFVRDG